jgi:DNA-binding transcriptional ArsR family regulator
VKQQLNPHFETFFLILNAEWGPEEKKEAIAAIDGIGMNGAAFYKAHFGVIERYYAAFQSRRVETTQTKLFKEMCEEVMYILLLTFWRRPEWLESMDPVTEEEVCDWVRQTVAGSLGSEDEIIEALEAQGFSDKIKWQIAALLQQPKQRLVAVAQAIRENIGAFEYACSKVEKELETLLEQQEELLSREDKASILSQPGKLNPDSEIIPTLAQPVAVIILEELCFCGLLTGKFFAKDDAGETKVEAILAAKALSDTSKLEILLALKEGSLYNLEIANKLGITPATASHHMNILLAASLVTVEKRDGKVYYHFSAEGMSRYAAWLNENFLK